jgi:hypothetical protein
MDDPAGTQPADGCRRRQPAAALPDPRPRYEVQPRLRRHLPERRHRDRANADPGAERECLRRALGRQRAQGVPRRLLTSVAASSSMSSASTSAISTSSGHTERSTCDRRMPAAEPTLRRQRPLTRVTSVGATSSADYSTNTKTRREDRVCAPHAVLTPQAVRRRSLLHDGRTDGPRSTGRTSGVIALTPQARHADDRCPRGNDPARAQAKRPRSATASLGVARRIR